VAGKPARSGPPGNKNNLQHGLFVYKAMLDGKGQEHAVIADAIKNMLYLASLDNYLMGLKSLVRKGRAHPVLAVRTQLAAHLREDLKTLGLSRRVKTTTINDLLNQDAGEQNTARGGMVLPIMRTLANKPLTVNNGQSERCANPFCKGDMTARRGKKYCSDRYRLDGYVLRRAKAMIHEVGIIEFNSRLQDLNP
jgi:hypothetical protein